MNKRKFQLRTKCPACGSNDIYTMGFDQLCFKCDWNNSLALVQAGQMNQPFLAFEETFGSPPPEKAQASLEPDAAATTIPAAQSA